MDKEHVKGGVKEAVGDVKKGVGKATGNKRLENEGRVDEAEGKARKALGDVKDAFKKKPS